MSNKYKHIPYNSHRIVIGTTNGTFMPNWEGSINDSCVEMYSIDRIYYDVYQGKFDITLSHDTRFKVGEYIDFNVKGRRYNESFVIDMSDIPVKNIFNNLEAFNMGLENSEVYVKSLHFDVNNRDSNYMNVEIGRGYMECDGIGKDGQHLYVVRTDINHRAFHIMRNPIDTYNNTPKGFGISEYFLEVLKNKIAINYEKKV